MGMDTFESLEIKNQAERIKSQTDDICRTGLSQVQEFSNQISAIVKSGDSSLASEWAAVAEAAYIAGSKIQTYGNVLSQSLINYANTTISNEELVAADTKKASEEIKTTISGLSELSPLDVNLLNSYGFDKIKSFDN